MSKYPNLLIRASAGTGKTFQLSNRFIDLLNSGAPPDEILASTFTRKAAGEILDRVVLRLAGAALEERQLAELARFVNKPPLDQAKVLELLEQLIRAMHRLRICTLDSFFSQVASTLSLELGLPPRWTIIEEIHDESLRNEAIEALLRDNTDQDVRRLMHLMTKGDAERSVGELLRATVSSLYNLYTETTAECWQQFPDRKPLGAEQLAAAIGDLESVSLPDDRRWQKARETDVLACYTEDWEQFIGKGIAAKVLSGESTFFRKPIAPEVHDVYGRLIDHARAVIINQLARQTAATYELLDRFDSFYSRLKNQAHRFRFEDVTRHLSGWTSSTDARRDHFRLDTRLAHLLLDEFQDTSMAQWTILRPLAERVTQPQGQQAFFWQGGQSSFFCVGDVKQAIYGWRGGRSEIFDALETQLPGLQCETLNESYRSAVPVIETVNRVFSNLQQHTNLDNLESGIRQWSASFESQTTALTAMAGYAELLTARVPREDETQSDATIQYVAEHVAGITARAPGRSVGVLARRNSVVTQLIFELRRLGVDASEEGGSPLVDSAAVQIIMSLLKIADHPTDRVARFHLAGSPLAAEISRFDPAGDADARQLANQIRQSLMTDGYGPTVYRWATQLARGCNRRDRSRLYQLVEMAYEYQSIASLRTSDFLRYIRSRRVADPTPASVRVMTIHQAKGLEFDVVVLADLDSDLIGQYSPCVVAQPDPAEPISQVCLYRNVDIQQLLPPEMQKLFTDSIHQSVYESLCVLYVALTRARNALHMIIAPSRRNERTLHKTFAGLLRASLTDGSPLDGECVAYQHGDPDWYEQPGGQLLQADQPPGQRPVEEPEQQPLRLATPLARRDTSLQFTSPSSLEGGQQVSAASVIRLDNAAALSRGTLVHAWLEQLPWLDEGPPDAEQLRKIALHFDTSGLNVDKLIKQFLQMLQVPQISECMSRQYYQPPRRSALLAALPDGLSAQELSLDVHHERRFLVRDGERMMTGSIDRLVLLSDGQQLVAADVVDYKTDAIAAGDEDRLRQQVEFYRPQMDAYCRAVSKMFPLPPNQISARLVFITAGIVSETTNESRLVGTGRSENSSQ